MEALIGGTNDEEDLVDLVTQIQRVNEKLTLAKEVLNKKKLLLEAEYASKHETVQQEMLLVRREKADLCGEVLLLRRELQGKIYPLKMRIPETKSYNGVRSAKELQNILWNVENYFKAARILDGE